MQLSIHQLASKHRYLSDVEFMYSFRPPPHHPFLKFAEATFAHFSGPGKQRILSFSRIVICRMVFLRAYYVGLFYGSKLFDKQEGVNARIGLLWRVYLVGRYRSHVRM